MKVKSSREFFIDHFGKDCVKNSERLIMKPIMYNRLTVRKCKVHGLAKSGVHIIYKLLKKKRSQETA